MSYQSEKKGVAKYMIGGALVGGAIVGLADHFRNHSYADNGAKLTKLRG